MEYQNALRQMRAERRRAKKQQKKQQNWIFVNKNLIRDNPLIIKLKHLQTIVEGYLIYIRTTRGVWLLKSVGSERYSLISFNVNTC